MSDVGIYPEVVVRRLQISIDESLDEQLTAEAARRGTSKAALIRQAVRQTYGERTGQEDALDALAGDVDAAPVDDVDAVIYSDG